MGRVMIMQAGLRHGLHRSQYELEEMIGHD